MKRPIFSGVTFSPSNQTLDFSSVSGFDLRALLAVINLTANAIIYVPGRAGLGYTNLNGSVVTLAYDTSEMASTDVLLALYDDGVTVLPAGAATDAELKKARTIATTDNPGTIPPGGVVSALAANANRSTLILSNTGNGALTYRFGNDPSASVGHALAPGDTKSFSTPCPAGELRLFSTDGTQYFLTNG